MSQFTIKTNDSLFVIAKQSELPLVHLIKANPEISEGESICFGKIIKVLQLPAIPRQLDTIESNAMDIIDNIYAGEWENAASNLSSIKTNMNELVPFLQDASVPVELMTRNNLTINGLNQSIMQKNRRQAISQANQITMNIADILDYFSVIVPTDIKRLSYLGRQMIIGTENNDWDEVNDNYLELKRVWERVKPQLDAQYSGDIEGFDTAINNLGQSVNRKIYQTTIDNTSTLLDQIDTLASDFTEQNSSGTQPTTPETEPTAPGTCPTTPGAQPTTPGTCPTTPGTQPTTPETRPTTPPRTTPTMPTTPGMQPTTPPRTTPIMPPGMQQTTSLRTRPKI